MRLVARRYGHARRRARPLGHHVLRLRRDVRVAVVDVRCGDRHVVERRRLPVRVVVALLRALQPAPRAVRVRPLEHLVVAVHVLGTARSAALRLAALVGELARLLLRSVTVSAHRPTSMCCPLLASADANRGALTPTGVSQDSGPPSDAAGARGRVVRLQMWVPPCLHSPVSGTCTHTHTSRRALHPGRRSRCGANTFWVGEDGQSVLT